MSDDAKRLNVVTWAPARPAGVREHAPTAPSAIYPWLEHRRVLEQVSPSRAGAAYLVQR